MIAAPAKARDERRRASRELRSQRVLEAALQLFAERGYHDTAVDDVVAQARTSKSTFYEFFESKEDCLRELLRREGGQLMHRVLDEAVTGDDHRDRLRRGIHAFVAACAERVPLARLLLIESVGVSPAVEEVRHAIHGRFAGLVEDEVRRAGAHDGFYSGVDPEVFGRALVGAVNEATAHFLARPGHAVDLAESLCQVFAPRA